MNRILTVRLLTVIQTTLLLVLALPVPALPQQADAEQSPPARLALLDETLDEDVRSDEDDTVPPETVQEIERAAGAAMPLPVPDAPPLPDVATGPEPGAVPAGHQATRAGEPVPGDEVADDDVPAADQDSAAKQDSAKNADKPATERAPDEREMLLPIAPLVIDASDRIAPIVPLADAVTTADRAAQSIKMLGAVVPPGTYRRLDWTATELFEGVPVSTPVLVINGSMAGPTLCLTAAVHGDELNGIEMVRRVMHQLNPDKLSGAVIGVPIVNVQGFRRGSRYLPDRRDLNRYFPGNPNGSAASRIAYSFFTEIVMHCSALIDLHTGSFERANLPQLRADLRNPDVVTLTQGFGATVILHSKPASGTLRHAATQAGVPTVTLEAGGPSELELKEVQHGAKGIETLLHTLGMVKRARLWGDPEPVYYRSTWIRANRGGILLADVSLGTSVRRGDLLGTITDPMNNASTNLYSPYSGRIIGLARNQVVMPGFAAFHVGIETEQAGSIDSTERNSLTRDQISNGTLDPDGAAE